MSVTYRPKKKRRKKTHGFLVRMRSAGGQRVLKKRRTKGRHRVAL